MKKNARITRHEKDQFRLLREQTPLSNLFHLTDFISVINYRGQYSLLHTPTRLEICGYDDLSSLYLIFLVIKDLDWSWTDVQSPEADACKQKLSKLTESMVKPVEEMDDFFNSVDCLI